MADISQYPDDDTITFTDAYETGIIVSCRSLLGYFVDVSIILVPLNGINRITKMPCDLSLFAK